MTCMTTKQKFEVEDPNVVVLKNGRYAFRVKCPWEGKNGKELHAFKFCSTAAFKEYEERQKTSDPPPEAPTSPTSVIDTPETEAEVA